MLRRKFESGGLATGKMGLATLGAPLAILTLPLMLITPKASMVSIIFLIIYLYGYRNFFSIIIKKNPFFLPVSIVLGLYFSSVIALGAFFGFIRVLVGIGRVNQNILE